MRTSQLVLNAKILAMKPIWAGLEPVTLSEPQEGGNNQPLLELLPGKLKGLGQAATRNKNGVKGKERKETFTVIQTKHFSKTVHFNG